MSDHDTPRREDIDISLEAEKWSMDDLLKHVHAISNAIEDEWETLMEMLVKGVEMIDLTGISTENLLADRQRATNDADFFMNRCDDRDPFFDALRSLVYIATINAELSRRHEEEMACIRRTDHLPRKHGETM